MARLGWAWCGPVWFGKVRLGMVWPGKAWWGKIFFPFLIPRSSGVEQCTVNALVVGSNPTWVDFLIIKYSSGIYMTKKKKKKDSPFLSSEETLINLLRIVFLNGDTMSPSILQRALFLDKNVCIEIMSHVFGSVLTSNPEELEEDLKERGEWIGD